MTDRTAPAATLRGRGRFAPALGVLLLGTLLCGGLAVWAATSGFKAKQCLEGELHPDRNGASITERGCEVTTASGEQVLVPVPDPPFEAGVAGALGFVVLGATTGVVLAKRRAGRPLLRP